MRILSAKCQGQTGKWLAEIAILQHMQIRLTPFGVVHTELYVRLLNMLS